MTEKKKIYLLIFLTLISCLFSYRPFLGNLSTVGRYLDGPNYILVAKTFYSKITANNAFYMPVWYFACHLIGYPFFIRLFNYLFVPLAGKSSYLYSMLFSTIIFSIGCTLIFYKFLSDFRLTRNPFWLSVVFIFFPPRWLLYHSVGASEPEFIFWCLLSLYFFKKEKYAISYLSGILATLTRIFGVLLFPIYIILFLYKIDWKAKGNFLKKLPVWKILGILTMPLALFVHFLWYLKVYNMFWAYYQWNSGQLGKIPFGALLSFNKYWQPGVAELYVFMMSLIILGLIRIYKQKEIFWFSLIQFLPTTLNIQGDFPRFLTTITMFVWLVAFDDFFNHRYFKLVFPVYLLLTYLYIWSVIPTNLVPPDVWINLIGDQV